MSDIITQGKTKVIKHTGLTHNGVLVVEFELIGSSVMADGTGTIGPDRNSRLLIQRLIEQNDNIFTFLNGLGFQTTYVGKNENGLYHEFCEPYLLEFVYRGAVCDGSSIIKREPEKYGATEGYEGCQLSTNRANRKFFNKDGSVLPFKKPILETFHKKMLVEKADGAVDLILESEAKKNPRYFKDGNQTQYAHEDPILVRRWPYAQDCWSIFNQKKPLNDNLLALINWQTGNLLSDCGRKIMRPMEKNEYVDAGTEKSLQNTTKEIMRAINTAALITDFKKAEYNKVREVVFKEYIGGAFIIDGKCEYGLVTDKNGNQSIKLTDDMVSDNMRWAFDWQPAVSLKRMFQNYESLEQKLLIASMVAEGTKIWTDPKFIRNIKYILGR